MKKNYNPNLKRVIVDFKKLTPEILALVVQKYPDGYSDSDVIQFRNANYELIEAIEITTEDTKYLVKVSKRLVSAIKEYDTDDDNDNDALTNGDMDIEDS